MVQTNHMSAQGQEACAVGAPSPWPAIEAYFRGRHLAQLVRHQVESYNDLVSVQKPRTISMFNPVRARSEHDFVAEAGGYRL